jgi:septum formation protein
MRHSLVLASGSPRRQELLATLGVSFSTQTADLDESPLSGEPPKELVMRLSRAKALAVTERLGQALGNGSLSSSRSPETAPGLRGLVAVLAADTVVSVDGVALGKPADAAEAIAMLRALRGRTHQVYTSVTLIHQGRLDTRLSASDVTMRAYTDHEIAAYVATGDPLDKAGAYAIQHEWFAPVANWSGCFSGIMGLPLGAVAELLTQTGLVSAIDVAPSCEPFAGRCCMQTGRTYA